MTNHSFDFCQPHHYCTIRIQELVNISEVKEMDLPTEIWIHILSEYFASYYEREKLWLQNVDSLLQALEPSDLDLVPDSIYARQKKMYYMAFHFITFNRQFAMVMQSRQIWKYIYNCTIGTTEWRKKVPQEFEIRLGGDYLATCKFLRTFHFESYATYIIGHNSVRQYVPDATKNLKKSCDRCQRGLPHEHLVKFNARTQKLEELKNWPNEVQNRVQVLNADGKYVVITTRDEIVLFDIDGDNVTHKFSTDVLPRQFQLFFINIYKKKLVFAIQGLGMLLKTLILDLDKGVCITDDDISNYASWPGTPYYVSKDQYNFRSNENSVKVLNDDNSFSTLVFESIDPKSILKTDTLPATRFMDSRMLVAVENEGVYEVNPLTREILHRFPYFPALESKLFLGSFVLSFVVDPEQCYSTATLQDIYTAKAMGKFRFRSLFKDWNSLLNDEPMEEPMVLSLE